MIYDLHTHTNFSMCASSENTWQELLKKAEKAKIELLSITDHNSCVFHIINKFLNTNSLFNGKIIPGMECDVVEKGMSFELLAYNFDVVKAFNWALKVYGTPETRQNKMKDLLIKKIEEKKLFVDKTKPFNAKDEYAHNYIYYNMLQFEENLEIFKKYNINSVSDFYRISTTNKSFPLYVDTNKVWPSTKKVVDAIHKFGGIVVLAHPYNYKVSEETTKILLNIVLEKNIDGVEVYHPSCNENQIKYLKKFVKENNLIATGGSDYHGNKKHNIIGIYNFRDNKISKF